MFLGALRYECRNGASDSVHCRVCVPSIIFASLSWLPLRLDAYTLPKSNLSYIIEEDVNEFPIGWEQRETPDGRVYFVDHINRSTTYVDPRIEHREERKKLALQHDATLPKYKRDLRRKLLRLRDLFTHQFLQYVLSVFLAYSQLQKEFDCDFVERGPWYV